MLEDESPTTSTSANVQAAVSRTLARGLALYFSRPVRLFRPSKLSGWHSLRATQGSPQLSTEFLTSLVKAEGHFIPPMIVNAALGTVLWTTYSEVYDRVLPIIPAHLTTSAAISGAAAGLAQSVVAAPAENVRLVLEGGKVAGSWSNAWKEVFRGTVSPTVPSHREDVRQVRAWMHEVRDMAGNGWKGWAWGAGKDIVGFSAFFSIFEVTRRIALNVTRQSVPRILHALTLITGGVTAGLVYEFVCRPFDHARRIIWVRRLGEQHQPNPMPFLLILGRHLKNEGLASLFKDPNAIDSNTRPSFRGAGALRTLGRVGPWGIGFSRVRNFWTWP
ncbi:hypothetical protein DL96DRAFT_1598389 [Flagelloscypha sp. PMI_526]|nr:hypothetical protein DL96DRAFT_1598389 [Flagelloscypha sp. PMI_526]